MKNSDPSMSSRIKSFRYAWNGIKVLYLEPNFKLHLLAIIGVSSLSFYFQISWFEWMFIIFATKIINIHSNHEI